MTSPPLCPRHRGHHPKSHFAMLYLLQGDSIRIIQFPPSVNEDFESLAIRPGWPKGISKRTWVDGEVLEIKLRGSPWRGMSTADNVHGRDLMCSVFSFLWERGWELLASPCHTVHQFSNDSLVFRKMEWEVPVGSSARTPSATGATGKEMMLAGRGRSSSGNSGFGGEGNSSGIISPQSQQRPHSQQEECKTSTLPPMDFMALSMPPADRLRVHGGGPEVIAEIQLLLQKFEYLKPKDSGKREATSWEFRMKGYPWAALMGKKPQKLRMFILGLVETMDRLGWTNYATIKQRETGDQPKPDTWYFRRPKGWSTDGEDGEAIFETGG
ncbi:hypothetical protein MKZ38_000431 [Zalerion maritima]|uniref:Uncharacterized protein n=1 Tax=Zalerion maritima TaxID=339359 RepID=A0AAD5S003_9PEZI|nr:hypothetical protein MKZ38_000431 [Zalerion maritima]